MKKIVFVMLLLLLACTTSYAEIRVYEDTNGVYIHKDGKISNEKPDFRHIFTINKDKITVKDIAIKDNAGYYKGQTFDGSYNTYTVVKHGTTPFVRPNILEQLLGKAGHNGEDIIYAMQSPLGENELEMQILIIGDSFYMITRPMIGDAGLYVVRGKRIKELEGN